MIDGAGILMGAGKHIACQRMLGVNDNMRKSHYHDYYELYYLEYGERYHMIDDKIYSINSGEFVIFSPHTMHHSYGDNEVKFKRIVLYFTPEAVNTSNIIDILGKNTGVYRIEKKYSQRILQLLNEILGEQEEVHDSYSDSAIQALLNLLLVKIVRYAKEEKECEKESRITNILHYIHENYMEPIRLENLAAKCFISPYYLCREFKKNTNNTIIQYINNVRIINAQRLLMETDKKVTEISKQVGFSNVTHFERIFKSITGITPSKYRKN